MERLTTIHKAYGGSLHKQPSPGFSILEMVVVVAVLGILASLTIPSFLEFIKSAKIDQAKADLNGAIADCLQSARQFPNSADTTVVPDESLSGPLNAGYRIASGKNKCVDFMLEPSNPSESFLFPIGFMVREGKVTKIAIPARDRSSENACKSWGTCGVPQELQAEWDRVAKIEADKKACNDSFYSFLNSGSKGQKNVWDEASNSCSRAQWVLDGTRYTTKEAYEVAFTAKVGKECLAELSRYASNNPPNGRYTNQNCDIDTYFLNGINLETSDSVIYQAKSLEYTQQQCAASEASWISGGGNGAFSPPSGIDCQAKWKCGAQIYTDEASYKSSSCGAPPPAPPAPAPTCRIMTRRGCILWR